MHQICGMDIFLPKWCSKIVRFKHIFLAPYRASRPILPTVHWWETVARLVWSKHGLEYSWVSIYILLGGPSPTPSPEFAPPPNVALPPSLLCLFTLSESFLQCNTKGT